MKRNGDHFRVSIISGSIWGSFRWLYRSNPVAFVWNSPVPSQSPAGYSTNIWVGATKGLKPRPCIGQNIPKIHTLSRTTPSILLPCLEQRTKCTPEQNSRYSHRSCQSTISERSRQHQIGEFFTSTPSAMYFLKKRVIFSAKCPVECCVFQFLLYKGPQR